MCHMKVLPLPYPGLVLSHTSGELSVVVVVLLLDQPPHSHKPLEW